MDISQLLKVAPQPNDQSQGEFGQEQRKDLILKRMIQFLETGNFPGDVSQLQKIAAQALNFSVVDGRSLQVGVFCSGPTHDMSLHPSASANKVLISHYPMLDHDPLEWIHFCLHVASCMTSSNTGC